MSYFYCFNLSELGAFTYFVYLIIKWAIPPMDADSHHDIVSLIFQVPNVWYINLVLWVLKSQNFHKVFWFLKKQHLYKCKHYI